MTISPESARDIAGLLLKERGRGTDWGEMSQLEGKPPSKKLANRFLLCALLDYQIASEVAWRNGDRLVDEILFDPEDIWSAMTAVSQNEWITKHVEYKLHRFPKAHNRLWQIARRICEKYGGDARSVWKGKDSAETLKALEDIGAGEQISRMVVGALRDCGQIEGASDVKADVHVCRVLGRVVMGERTDPETAVKIARQIHPADPWRLDAEIWYVGRSFCSATDPRCSKCYLAVCCEYAIGHSNKALRRRLLALAHFVGPLQAPRTEVTRPKTPYSSDLTSIWHDPLSDIVTALVQAAHDNGWILPHFDWPEWSGTEEAARLGDDPAFLAQASADQLAKLLTTVVRQDRFCDGTLNGAHESGLLIRILRRAAVLSDEIGEECP